MPHRTRMIHLALGGLIALAIAMGVGRFIYTPILPYMIEDLGLSKGDAGLIASANYLGYLIGALLGATPLVFGSRRTWMLSALVISAVTSASVGLVSSMPLFLILRLIGGVASALILVFASTLVLERLRANQRDGLASLHFAGVGSGIMLAGILVSVLVAAGIGWRGHWISAGLLSLIAIYFVARLVPDEAEPAAQPRKAQSQTWRMSLIILAYGLFGFGYVITATFIMTIVREFPQISYLEPYVWIIVGAAAIPSVAAWKPLANRFGIINAYGLACLVQAVGVAASVLWISAFGIVLAAVFLGGTIMAITALGLMAVQSLSGGDPRKAFALMTASFGLGQIIGPVFAGYLHDASGSFMVSSLVAAGALVIAALLSAIAARGVHRDS